MIVPTSEDHARVTAAVMRAERGSRGEVVTIVAPRSDKYHDVALHWAVVAMLAAMAAAALFPRLLERMLTLALGGWRPAPSMADLVGALMVLVALTFLLAVLALRWIPLRLALTPPATKTRRVRVRAIELFRIGAERRTRGRTGVLLYLSLAEHRAEIVADAAIVAAVAPELWGDAMGEMLVHVSQGRIGEGMAAAVDRMGAVLAEHFPHDGSDDNEIPDRLIAL